LNQRKPKSLKGFRRAKSEWDAYRICLEEG
jgi:hypothetical protein